MRQLRVFMYGAHNEARLLALPFGVYGPGGEPLGHGVVSPTEPALVILDQAAIDLPRAHVVATRPDGEQLQASVMLQDGINVVILRPRTQSPHEWLEWVTPFRSLEHLTERGVRSGLPSLVRRIGKVWVTVWELHGGRWRATDLRPQEQQRGDGARLIILDVPARPHLLQVGGDEVAWRLVSLPPRDQARVALTRRAAESGDTIDVTVGRTNPVNELIMSYLTSGATTAADQLAEAWQAADIALYKKMEDPVSAAAGAYVLLKMNRLERRNGWVSNLVNWFSYLADGPIVAAALELQRSDADLRLVRKLIAQAMERGLPVFSMGLSVLVETMAAIHRGKRETKGFQMHYQAARAYLQARASKGAYACFYGRSPAEPSWTRLYGDSVAPTVSISEHRLGAGPTTKDQSPTLGPIAPFPERTPALLPRSKSTDDLLRLGVSRQYSLPDMKGLQLSREFELSSWRLDALTTPIIANDWNAQRRNNAFNVFDGDE